MYISKMYEKFHENEQWCKKNQGILFVLQVFLYVVTAIIAQSGICFALPWDGPLEEIKGSMDTTVVQAVAACAVIGCGLTLAFSEISGVAKRMVQIVFGLAIAIGSAQLLKLFPK